MISKEQCRLLNVGDYLLFFNKWRRIESKSQHPRGNIIYFTFVKVKGIGMTIYNNHDLKHKIKAAFKIKNIMKQPKDFLIKPWGSVLQNSESETIAGNIMMILSRTGNTWRELTWEEYKIEREKDGEFSEREKIYFDKVIIYCKSPEDAGKFSKDWKDIL